MQFQGFAWQAPSGKLPSFHTRCTTIHWNFLKEVAVGDSTSSHPHRQADSPLHRHICILSPRPYSEDSVSGILAEVLFFTFQLLPLPCLPPSPPPKVHKKARVFCSGLSLAVRQLPLSVLHPSDPCPGPFHGEKWNIREPELLLTSCFHCHSKWIKAWLILQSVLLSWLPTSTWLTQLLQQ